MSYGLRVWNSSGQIRLDTSARLARYHSFYTGSILPNNSATVSVPGLANDGTWSVQVELAGAYNATDVDISINNGGFTISNGGGGSFNITATYNITVFRV